MGLRTIPRAIRALALSLLLLLATLGVQAGFSAAQGEGTGAAEEAIHTPPARLGDAGEYTAILSGDYPAEFVGKPYRALRFEWRTGEPVVDRDGRPVPTEELLLNTQDLQSVREDGRTHHRLRESNRTLLYRSGTTEFVATRGLFARAEDNTAPGPVPGVLDTHSATWLNASVLGYGGASMCVLAGPLQGRTLRVGDEVHLGAACAGLGYMMAQDPLRAIAMESWQDRPALRLRVAENRSGEEGNVLDAWYVDGVAYPVRVDLRMAPSIDVLLDKDAGAPKVVEVGARAIRWELTAFSAGEVDRPAAAEPGPAQPIPTAARTPWGLDGANVEQEFPIDEAYQRAVEDPLYAAFREFLEGHPDAVTVAAGSSVLTIMGERRTEWTFDVEDRQAGFRVGVTKRVSVDLERIDPPLAQRAARYEVTGYSLPGVRGIDRSNAPAELPTMAGLAARWALHTTPERAGAGANHWSFALECPMPGFRGNEACPAVEVHASVGRVFVELRSPEPSASGVSSGATLDSSRLELEDGKGVSYWQTVVGSESATGLAEPGPVSGFRASGQAAPIDVAGLGIPPLAPIGAGIAVLGGLLYWLWPILKGGSLVGLFSRVREHDLLQNPVRRRIVDAVAAQPGIHYKALLRTTGIPNGSLVHHLQKLRAAGLLVARTSNGYTCYFARGAADPAAAGAVKAEGAWLVLSAVQARPGLSGLEVAHATGLQPSTVAYHVQRLAQAGLVTTIRDGRAVRLHATARAPPAEAG